uniref:Uncharacterized protein n=1 Tax=mine drainage metagenome TaxID=410659 RepID=E6PZ16_9ZZZZ
MEIGEERLHLWFGEAPGKAGHFAFTTEDDAADFEVGGWLAVREFGAHEHATNVGRRGLESKVVFAVAMLAANVVEVLAESLPGGERWAAAAAWQQYGGCEQRVHRM